MAVKLSSGDAFLSALEGVEGPLAAYRAGRLKGLYRKVCAHCTALSLKGMYCKMGAHCTASPAH